MIHSHKNGQTIVPSQIPSSVPHDMKLYSYLRSQGDIPGSSRLLASPLLPDTTLPYVS